MGLIIIFISAVVAFFIFRKKSKSQNIYLSLAFLFVVLFILRFACGKLSCVGNLLLWNIYKCKECTPDWNIRAALDPAGLIFIGLILSMFFLYKKNYHWKVVLQSISVINVLGLAIEIKKLDEKIEELLDEEMKLELLDDNVQKKIAETNEHILKSTTPFNTLQLLKERLEFEFNRVEMVFNKQATLVNKKKQKQFEQLKIAKQDFLNLVDRDFTNRYVSKTVSFAQKILSMLFNLLDYVQSSPPKRNAKVLKNSIGVIITNDENKEKFDPILKQGDKIPIENSKIYRTKNNNQTSIESTILFESEYPIKNNKQTRRVVISGLPPKPAKQVEIETLFKIDKNGMLLVKNIHSETKNIVQEEFDINEYLEIEDDN